jgi:hypothetical protein
MLLRGHETSSATRRGGYPKAGWPIDSGVGRCSTELARPMWHTCPRWVLASNACIFRLVALSMGATLRAFDQTAGVGRSCDRQKFGRLEAYHVVFLLLILMIGGGAFELTGIVLGVAELRSRGARLRAFESERTSVRRSLGAAWEVNSASTLSRSDLPIDGRIDALEHRLEDQGDRLHRLVMQMHDDSIKYATARADDVETNLNRLFRFRRAAEGVTGPGAGVVSLR